MAEVWRANLMYAAMAALNFAIGYHYVHVLPVQLAGDVSQNIDVANALLGRGGELYYYRSWGYPLFLIATGFPWSRDPEIVLLVHLGLGSAIPFLVGSTLRLLGANSKICLLAAAVSLLSLSPILFAHSLLSDHVSLFLLNFVIWLIAMALVRTDTWLWAAAVGLAFFALYLMRQANVFLGPTTLAVGLTFKAHRRLMLRAVSVFLAITAAWIPLQLAWVSWSEGASQRSFRQADGSLGGAMFFWNIYSTGATFVGKSTIEKSNGPCSLVLYEAVQRRAPSITPLSVDQLMEHHTLLNHYVIWKSLEAEYGAKKMDGIFWCAAFEGVRAEPRSLLYLVDGMLSFFLVSDVIYNDGYRQAWPSIDYYANAVPRVLGGWALYVGTAIKIVAFLVAIAAFAPTYRRGGVQRTFLMILWAMVLYLAAVHVIFAAPHWRYTSVLIPGLVLLAGLGLDATLSRCRRP